MKDWIDIYFMNQPEEKTGMWKKKKKEMNQEAHGKNIGGINETSKNQITGYVQPERQNLHKSIDDSREISDAID